MLKDDRGTIVFSSINWTAYYMHIAGLLEEPRRGFYEISEEGLKVLKAGVPIDNVFLSGYKPLRDFLTASQARESPR